MDDKLSKILNVPPLLPVVKEDKNNALIETNEPESDIQQIEGDFDVARDAMISALETGQGALEVLAQVASGSQHPRAFEVLAKMVDTITSTSKDLINIHQQKRDLIKKPETQQTINNNLVISTNDLLKMIKGQDDDQS